MDFDAYCRGRDVDPATLTEADRSLLLSEWKAELGQGAGAGLTHELQAVADKYRLKHEQFPDVTARLDPIIERAKAEGWKPETLELQLMRAARPQGINNMPVTMPPGFTASVSEAALLLAHGVGGKVVAGWYGDQVVDRATKPDVRNVTLSGLMRATMAAAGMTPPLGKFNDVTLKAALQADAQVQIQAAGSWGPSTQGASFSSVLSNVANKLLLESWNGAGTTWQKFCRLGEDIPDFKQATRYRVTALGSLQRVPPGGEIRHIQVDAESYTNTLDTRAGMFGLDRRDMINDDLGAMTRVPRMFGRMAAISVEKAVYTLLLQNQSTFFTSGRKNRSTGAGSALADAGLTAAWKLAREQVDANSDPTLAVPSVMLVPPALETTAKKLNNSSAMVGNTTTDALKPEANVWEGLFDVQPSTYLGQTGAPSGTTGSDAAWIIAVGPGDFAIMEVAFLGGRQGPVIEEGQADPGMLGVWFRGYIDYGVAMAEYRGGVYSAGS